MYLSFLHREIYSIGVFEGLSIMVSFFAELVHTGNGVTCSDSGFMDLTKEECAGAVNYAKSNKSNFNYAYFNSVHSWSTVPKGCVISDYDNHINHINFNTHSTGGKSAVYSSICKKGNT